MLLWTPTHLFIGCCRMYSNLKTFNSTVVTDFDDGYKIIFAKWGWLSTDFQCLRDPIPPSKAIMTMKCVTGAQSKVQDVANGGYMETRALVPGAWWLNAIMSCLSPLANYENWLVWWWQHGCMFSFQWSALKLIDCWVCEMFAKTDLCLAAAITVILPGYWYYHLSVPSASAWIDMAMSTSRPYTFCG